ncbi:type II toxin-antitoxin system VapC family toxin [soil metagenome]
MKLPDLNLLIYAVDTRSHSHASALRWWNALMSGRETVALSWAVLLGFVRLTTNPRVMQAPLSADAALDYVDRWLAHPLTTVVEPTSRHATVMRDLLKDIGTAGNLVPDAHLATLAIEHGAELCSADRDFGRFAGLRWLDPLS